MFKAEFICRWKPWFFFVLQISFTIAHSVLNIRSAQVKHANDDREEAFYA